MLYKFKSKVKARCKANKFRLNFKAVINSLDDARSHLRRIQAAGGFSVKSYNQPRREQRQQGAAHEARAPPAAWGRGGFGRWCHGCSR